MSLLEQVAGSDQETGEARPRHTAVHAGAVCAAALVLASLALPWAGWQGLRTVGPAVALLGVVSLLLATRGWWRHGARLAAIAGAVAIALIVWRIASPRGSQATGALWLGAAGALVLMVAGSLSVAREHVVGARRVGAALHLEQRAALGAAWRALWRSRLLVWIAGVLGVLKLGLESSVHPPPLSRPFGALGNLLTAPASAWDAGSYLAIAQNGYAPGLYWRAYYPTYPSVVRAGAWSPRATLITAIVVALVAFAAALYLLHRLVSLECGPRVADLTVSAVAFSPMALFFSAAYTESLFLALSVAAFYAARRGWWARAGAAGALAAATRTTGLLLLLPLLVLYLYGPRDGEVRAPPPEKSWSSPRQLLRRLSPRHAPRRDAALLLLIPLGALAYFAYTAAHGDAAAPLHAEQAFWHRHFVPALGAVKGLVAAIQSVHQIAAGPGSHILSTPSFQAAGQLSDPLRLAGADLTDFAFFVFGCIATVGALRRLPAAYGLYALAMIAVTVSTFDRTEPLVSFPRYLVVLFPVQMWLALWAERGRRRQPTLLISAGLLAFFASQFATWRWVA
jgi:hypothetical protein